MERPHSHPRRAVFQLVHVVRRPILLVSHALWSRSFHYADAFGPSSIPDAYERLLLDALSGDAALFIRGDAIELGWRFIDPILEGLAHTGAPPAIYERGSWGPVQADALLARSGHAWLYDVGGHETG